MITKVEIEERLDKCNKILQETHAMINVLLEQKNAYSEDREEVEKIDTDLSAVRNLSTADSFFSAFSISIILFF